MGKKSGFVAIVGRPNVGKSTLMNTIIGQKIAITSSKPQTTRNNIRTIYNDERGQIVFIDTPGMHKAKNKLGDYMISSINNSLKQVDLILFLVEADKNIGTIEKEIIKKLSAINLPVILAVNKLDELSNKAYLLPIIDKYSKEYNFNEIVPISAKKADNTDKLIDLIFSYLEEGPMFYDEDTVTDQPVRVIATELIREKALRLLSDEIPHGIAVEIEKFSEATTSSGKSIIDIEAVIICEKDSHKGIIIGKGGEMLKKIATSARISIQDMMQCKVNIKIWVKVRKNWRDSDTQIKNFGYNIKDLN